MKYEDKTPTEKLEYLTDMLGASTPQDVARLQSIAGDLFDLAGSNLKSVGEPCSKSLLVDIKKVINVHSAEGESNTPDFILAGYLAECLRAFNTATNMREAHFGRDVYEDQDND